VTFSPGSLHHTYWFRLRRLRFGSVKKISPRGWETEPDTPHLLSNNLPSDVIAEEIAKAISIVAAQVTK
jgi:hypothetical protein